jgi:RNA polymerase subunit RPABC4/transcription elongation factor Spt4
MPGPQETKFVTSDKCDCCGGNNLDEPKWFESVIIEDLPEPQPLRATEFLLAHQKCKDCGREIVAKHPDCPKKGGDSERT